MKLVHSEVLDRDLEHDIRAHLGLALDAQRELVIDHWYQVSRHLAGCSSTGDRGGAGRTGRIGASCHWDSEQRGRGYPGGGGWIRHCYRRDRPPSTEAPSKEEAP